MKKLLHRISEYLRHADLLLYLLCMAITAVGIVSLVALANTGYIDTSPGIPFRTALVQLGAAGAGVLGAFILSRIDYHTIGKLWKLHLPVCVLLVLLTFIVGEGVGEADDVAWLRLFGGMTLQPTEMLKISFIVTFAYHLSKVGLRLNDLRNVLLLLLHAGALIFLVHKQGDDGTALIFALICVSMLFIAGFSWWYIAACAVLLAAGAPVIWFYVMNDDQRGRILALYTQGETAAAYESFLFQQNRGLIAIGSGQVHGVGLFSGEHSYVPAMRNDFIFSFIGEALGFVGCCGVILLLCGICLKVLGTSYLALDDLGRYICVGVFAMIAFQTVINIGMNLKLLPVVGVTLPFLSAGGTSVMAVWLGIGLVLSVYMHSRKNLFLDK
ncbi:MAG: FtsW/RodA/SpoVE family cell cycle protein [Provencibacterium sp.]|jgi:rod shape determining protein RodA|nr:FtsW/RodA/SpoVE family cell cycle protein [Provencibacterium sp.]